jgi:hypothetical protein
LSQRCPDIAGSADLNKNISGVGTVNGYLITLCEAPVVEPFSFEDYSGLRIGGFGDGEESRFSFHCV